VQFSLFSFLFSKFILCGLQNHISVSSPNHRSAGLWCHTVFVNLSSASLYWGTFLWYKWPYKVYVLVVKAYGEKEVEIYKSFSLPQIYKLFSSPLDEVKWLASRYRRFTPGETAASIGSNRRLHRPQIQSKIFTENESLFI